MVSDSINASIPYAPKDFGKKKKANRSAKLKQCKLDARREQWLSQDSDTIDGGGIQLVAVKNKGSKEEPSGQQVSPCDNERKNATENLETKRRGRGDEDEKENEEEEEEADDDCLDDWEAVADALAANDDNKQENRNDNPCPCLVTESSLQIEHGVRSDSSSNNLGSTCEDLKQEGPRKALPRLSPGNSRAWRPDDAFRPQSLPNLSKQRSFPNAEGHRGQGGFPWHCSKAVNVPSSCPICCEELDVTDTSFLPCICGYRLCLFCYNRILHVEDGRCPGCRKNYEGNAEEAELSVNGGSLSFRLSRSYSMVARS
ncbi:hypothetical protein GH714_022241 [Hevea brasiliensis]|uniref:RING-type domain-containing protein n=1 Tax=Hevea brasiliensis TaxID=3981 RepID=A0A6A6MG89_HEVBR|nr:hypothetical protein GH714_022241 [Hevea brasiliensis]